MQKNKQTNKNTGMQRGMCIQGEQKNSISGVWRDQTCCHSPREKLRSPLASVHSRSGLDMAGSLSCPPACPSGWSPVNHPAPVICTISLSLFLSAYPPSWIFTPLKKTENQCLCNLNLCPEPTRLSHVDLMTFEICSEPTGSHLLRAEPRGCVLESEPGAERSPAH